MKAKKMINDSPLKQKMIFAGMLLWNIIIILIIFVVEIAWICLLLVSLYGFIWALPSRYRPMRQDRFFIPLWLLGRLLIYRT